MVGNGPASRRAPSKWTLVQHSGYGFGGDTQFIRAVEIASIETKKEIDTIEKLGGLIFDSYIDADEAEYAENYPDPNDQSIIPNCRGTFARAKISGLKIYIPLSKDKTP